MSNNNVSDVSALTTVSGSFYRWLENDVVDNVAGVFMLIIFLIGMVLNILVIRELVSNKHKTMTSKPVFVQLIVIDFVAYLLIILPGIVASFDDSLIFPDGFCVINGLSVSMCRLASFLFMAVLCCERTTQLWKPRVHEHVFEKRKFSVAIVALVWLVSATLSALPLTGYGKVEYIPLQQRCHLHGSNQLHMHLLFAFGIYTPAIIVCICAIFTYARKRQIILTLSKLNKQVESINMKLAKRNDENKTMSASGRYDNAQTDLSVSEMIDGASNDVCSTITQSVPFRMDTSASSKHYRAISDVINHIPTDTASSDVTTDIEDGDSQVTVRESITSRPENDANIEIISGGITRNKTKLSKVKVMFNVYQSSTEERDVTLAVSYILMYLVVLGTWLPYVALSYVDGDEDTVWGGWFSLVVLVSDISYCIKPVVYLSHNSVLKMAAVESFPESVRNRAAKAQAALRKITKKLDSLVFIQIPDTKSLLDIKGDRVRVSPTSL
ncbi:uncharacterized protein LOC110447752 [Mizuhopecten yessoensis]|nr:uncharacterized protein LOC110447752 [Mizuhopecten yessoensis]